MKIKNRILIVIMMIFILTGCSQNRIPLTNEEFVKRAKDAGYNAYNISNQITNEEATKSVYIAFPDDVSYQIELWTMTNEVYAISFFEENQQILQSAKEENAKEKNIESSGFNKYILETSDKYNVISRIGDTAIYVSCDKKYKNKVKSLLLRLGY